MKRGISGADRAFYILVDSFLFLAVLLTLYPFLYTLSMSLSSVDAVNRNAVWLFPVEPTLEGYRIVLSNRMLFVSFGNSLYYTVAGTLLNLAATCLAAYPLSRRQFVLRKPLNFFLAFTMYFSGGLIPTYFLLTSMGFYNSRWVMILP